MVFPFLKRLTVHIFSPPPHGIEGYKRYFSHNSTWFLCRKSLRILFPYLPGIEGGIVVAKCESKDWGYGYDAALGEYNDLLETGVLDPAKVK